MRDPWGAFCCSHISLEPAGDGILNGKTFAVKDVFDIQGYVPGAGSPEWKRTHPPSVRHAESILMLLREGARLVGTTHTDELMFSLNGENYHYGTPMNPRAVRHIPGGSSSGSAVAVSAGLVDFALGTDTGGSVRVPASYCGIYGFRPTHGAVPTEGVVPLAPSFDTVGWFAHNPRLLYEIGMVLLGKKEVDGKDMTDTEHDTEPHAPVPPFRRIHVGTDALSVMDPASREKLLPVIRRTLSLAETHGEIRIAAEGLEEWLRVFRILQGAEVWRTHRQWIEEVQPRFGPGVAERFAWSKTVSEYDTAREANIRCEIRRRMAELLGEDGLIVMPTTPGPAPLRNTQGTELEDLRSKTLQLCCVAGLAGLPQITLPWAEVNGLPLGLSFVAGPHQDLRLLRWGVYLAHELKSLCSVKDGKSGGSGV